MDPMSSSLLYLELLGTRTISEMQGVVWNLVLACMQHLFVRNQEECETQVLFTDEKM